MNVADVAGAEVDPAGADVPLEPAQRAVDDPGLEGAADGADRSFSTGRSSPSPSATRSGRRFDANDSWAAGESVEVGGVELTVRLSHFRRPEGRINVAKNVTSGAARCMLVPSCV